jgi:4-amino-4-deoxy-L-arabinose transferase-like glycosyltransferase
MSRRLIWILWMTLAAVWFGTLEQRALVRPDEGRYAEIPREMVASGDWLTPRLNEFKYFEKPALQYWATAAGYKLFGESEWTARLWPALTGFLSILLAWWTGRRLWGPLAGHLAAAILASSLLFVVLGHLITLDMGLSFFLQVAWTAFLFAQNDERSVSRRWMLLAWGALALAVLSKGLVALVLVGAALVGYTLLNRDLSPWKRLVPLRGLLLFLLIAAPWFVAVSLANPEFPQFFFIHEHFERFLSTVHRRDEPGWYFFAVYALGALPWSLLLVHTLLKSWSQGTAGRFSADRFLLVWILSSFAFFSVSGSKMAPYILPVFPALALLGGRHIASLSRRAWLIHLALLALLAVAALAVAPRVLRLAGESFSPEMLQGVLDWLTGAAAVSLASILAALFLVWRQRNERRGRHAGHRRPAEHQRRLARPRPPGTLQFHARPGGASAASAQAGRSLLQRERLRADAALLHQAYADHGHHSERAVLRHRAGAAQVDSDDRRLRAALGVTTARPSQS